MQKTALAVETYSHFDTFESVKRLLKECGFYVDEERTFRFFSKILLRRYGKLNLIYINTIYGRQTFIYGILIPLIKKWSKVKIVIGSHNIFIDFFERLEKREKEEVLNYFSEHYRDFFGLRTKKIFRFYLKVLNFLMRVIRNHIDGIVVFGDYIECFSKHCVKIPTRLTDEEKLEERIKSVSEISEPTFVIPGGVLESVRNYEEFFEALLRRKPDIKLKLLGKMKSEKIKEKILRESYLQNRVVYFEKFVPEDVFISEMIKSHFAILMPKFIPPYGRYKATGGFHDAVSTGVPLMIPESFSRSIDGPLIRYKDMSHLMDLIEEAAESVRKGEYVERYLKPFLEYSKKFTPERIKKRFERFLEEIGVN